MVCRGDVPSNWEFFKQQWKDYEVVTGLDQRSTSGSISDFPFSHGKGVPANFPQPEFWHRRNYDCFSITSAGRLLSAAEECGV